MRRWVARILLGAALLIGGCGSPASDENPASVEPSPRATETRQAEEPGLTPSSNPTRTPEPRPTATVTPRPSPSLTPTGTSAEVEAEGGQPSTTGQMGDGAQVAYIGSDGNVWVVNAETLGNRSLTADGSPEEPYEILEWAPQADKIAVGQNLGRDIFISYPCVLRIVKTDGSEVLRLPDSSWDMSWSPDGARTAFVQHAPPGDCMEVIFVANADGSGYQQVACGYKPVWAPDGRHILYVAVKGLGAEHVGDSQDLRLVDISGSAGPVLAALPTWAIGTVWGLQISPDGAWVTSWRYSDEGFGQLDLVKADGSGMLPLVSMTQLYAYDWSPDGKSLVFSDPFGLDPDSEQRIEILDVTTGETVVQLPDWGTNLRWSPDGESIAYTTWGGGLAVFSSDGSGNRTLLADTPENLYYGSPWGVVPTWSPEGDAVAFPYVGKILVVDTSTGEVRHIADGSMPVWQPSVTAP